MKIKRVFALIIALFLLAGCGRSPTAEQEQNGSSLSEEDSKDIQPVESPEVLEPADSAEYEMILHDHSYRDENGDVLIEIHGHRLSRRVVRKRISSHTRDLIPRKRDRGQTL